ncbi:hypothetical protein [Mycobacterium sp. KBS0706]|nr:hypothetical protein [Mycobacterium sp. KBS0706]
MARLARKKTIGLLPCLGAMAAMVAGWVRARSIYATRHAARSPGAEELT